MFLSSRPLSFFLSATRLYRCRQCKSFLLRGEKMSIRTVVILFLCVLSAVFLAVNWSGIVAPVPVNLLYTQVEAPLGLILFVILGILLIGCVLWSLMQQAAVLVDIRKAYKEARTNKRLAEDAEQSRIQASADTLTHEFSELSEQLTAALRTESEKTGKQLENVIEQLKVFETHLTALDTKISQIAEVNGLQLPPQEPPAERKHSFFGFFGTKTADAKEVKKEPEEKQESSDKENLRGN